ncbi:MAG: hypothetical protein HYX40_02730 [Sphingobacteriales bacterium]|nr:hypothetical protein [Sphingobacteriales bacterium]
MDANAFIKIWNEFSIDFEDKNPNWLQAYANDNDWTNLFLGGKKSSSTNSPIGNYFFSKNNKLRYRTEDGSFDIAFSYLENYNLDIDGFYPPMYDVIIEVENQQGRAWQEMTKLIWVRSPLKVLVIYNWHPNDKTQWQKENIMLSETFKGIIKQSNQAFAENPSTEYLLIIGNNEKERLNWKHFKFDNAGQRK